MTFFAVLGAGLGLLKHNFTFSFETVSINQQSSSKVCLCIVEEIILTDYMIFQSFLFIYLLIK